MDFKGLSGTTLYAHAFSPVFPKICGNGYEVIMIASIHVLCISPFHDVNCIREISAGVEKSHLQHTSVNRANITNMIQLRTIYGKTINQARLKDFY